MSLNYRRDIKQQKRRRKNLVTALVTLSILAVGSGATYLFLIRPSLEQSQMEQNESVDRIDVKSATPDSLEVKNTELLYSQIGIDTDTEALTATETEVSEASSTESTEETTTEADTGESTEDPVPAGDGTLNSGYTKAGVAVDDSYFDDALFIGDSRTEGFSWYCDLAKVNSYSSKGLSVTRIYEDAIVTLDDGRQVTVMEALQNVHYSKIYIMFGVNELGWIDTTVFREKYETMIADIRSLQPGCMIYVQGIIPVSAERSATDSIYNNDRVRMFNEEIKQACINQNVVYLDVGSAIADETGALPAGASTDGIHCNSEYCNIWLDYLRKNTYTMK